MGAFYAEDISRFQQAHRLAALTHHLATPQVLARVSFPAGSEVVLRDDGRIDHATVPSATSVLGVPLIGAFTMEPSGVRGTLAAAAILEGVPCRADRVWLYLGDEVRCVLDRSFTGLVTI